VGPRRITGDRRFHFKKRRLTKTCCFLEATLSVLNNKIVTLDLGLAISTLSIGVSGVALAQLPLNMFGSN
jgi:hypothetical protein